VVIVGLLTVTSPTIAAGVDEDRGEVSVQLGARWVDAEFAGSDFSDNVRPVFGLGTGWRFYPRWNWFVDGNLSRHQSQDLCAYAEGCDWLIDRVRVLTLRSGVGYRFGRPDNGSHWFLDVAPGWMDIEIPGIQMHHSMLSLGGGWRLPKQTGALRLELRFETMFGDATDPDLEGTSHERLRAQNATIMLSWAWGYGGPRKTDDGVAASEGDAVGKTRSRRDNAAPNPAAHRAEDFPAYTGNQVAFTYTSSPEGGGSRGRAVATKIGDHHGTPPFRSPETPSPCPPSSR
jgi:hypothetical protein